MVTKALTNRIKASGDLHPWGCLMVDFPTELAEQAINYAAENIPDEILYTDVEDPTGYGRETHIHTTVCYGLDPAMDRQRIKDVVDGLTAPVKVRLGKISKFEPEDYDVIKVEVESEDLHALHDVVKALGVPGETYPDYKPHLTLAYVKKGAADTLLGQSPFEGQEFELTSFDYSAPPEPGAKDKHTKYQVQASRILAMPAVYHGTPHDVEQFSIEKVGTGEGYQAFGWGIYFSDAKEVADFYRKKLANDKNKPPTRWFNDQKLVPGSPEYHAGTLLSNGQSLVKVRKEVQSWISNAEGDPNYAKEMEGWKKTLAILNEAKSPKDFKEDDPEGNLYTANIPDVSQLLDWDKMIAGQPAGVRNKIEATEAYVAANERAKDRKFKGGPELSGGEFYGALQHYGKMTPKEASLYLSSLGIPGLCYFDSDSRGNGTGTRNYVIWDDTAIKDEKLHASSQSNPAIENPEFEAWFGASAVRDSKGRPKLVFHGTDVVNIEKFYGDTGDEVPGLMYFTDKVGVAKSYGSILYGCYLRMSNPLIEDAGGARYGDILPINFVMDAMENGYDGVILKNVKDDVRGMKKGTNYMVWNSDQVWKVSENQRKSGRSLRPSMSLEERLALQKKYVEEEEMASETAMRDHDAWVNSPAADQWKKDREKTAKAREAEMAKKGQTMASIVANKFDQLYKQAVTVSQDDAKYSVALENPALAQEQGQFQQQVKDARSEDDLQRVWNTFQPSVSWEALTAMVDQPGAE